MPRSRQGHVKINWSRASQPLQQGRTKSYIIPMPGDDCSRCHYPHPSGQICPHQLFEIPLCIKESDRWLGHLIIRYNTPDTVLSQQIADCYRRDAKSQKWTIKFHILSDRLYVASADCQYFINWCLPSRTEDNHVGVWCPWSEAEYAKRRHSALVSLFGSPFCTDSVHWRSLLKSSVWMVSDRPRATCDHWRCDFCIL